tara:strand:- start:653 stop:1048 length:396 start_codon:yes stop_codon:yes gene_type:complete
MKHISCSNDIDPALNHFLDNGNINKTQREEINRIILSIINHPEIKEFYTSNILSYNEREIIVKDGKNLIPDRIVIPKKNTAIIIDYKTGDFNNYHIKQLNDYQNALKKMGYSVVKKILVYIKENSIEVQKC